MKTGLLFLFLIAIQFGGYTQEVEVIGNVKDQLGSNLPYANVIFTNQEDSLQIFGTLVNDIGNFKIKLPKQKYILKVSFLGSQATEIKLDLSQTNKMQNLGDIVISTELELDDIVVKGSTSAYKLELDKKVYQVSKDILGRGGDLADVMQNIPSVQVEMDGKVSLRGNGNVLILVDGRPSGLTSTTAFFRTIPANSIESIEVITNPSSKYTSEGSAGIINVVLKKGKKKRLSSSVELFSGVRLNSGVNVNINKANKKYSWYFNSGLGYSKPKATHFLSLKNFSGVEQSKQYSEKILSQFYFLANLGGHINLTERQTLSTDISYRIAHSNNPSFIQYQDYNETQLSSSSERLNTEKGKNNFFQVNLGYEFKINEKKGTELKANLNIQAVQDDDDSQILESAILPNPKTLENDQIFKIVSNEKQVFSLDYINPMKNKSRFELGFQARNTKIKNDFSVQSLDNTSWEIIPELTDQANYSEKIMAFYGQYAKSYSKFKFQLGLRSETSMISTNAQQEFKKVRNYTNLFPSSFFDYQFNENNSIRLSFSRRIRRPSARHLMAYTSFSDSRNVFTGNSILNPSYSILSELSYKSEIGNNLVLNPTLFHRHSTEVMDYFIQKEAIRINGELEDIFVTRMVNIGDNSSYGLELGISYTPFTWFKIYSEITFNKFKQTGFYQNVNFDSQGIFVYGRVNCTFLPTKSFRFQIQHRFRNGRDTGQLLRKGVYRMDAGISMNLFKNNASLTVNFKDVFDTWEWKIKTRGENFTQDIQSQVRTPQVNVSFIYRINQKKYKGKKGRQYDKM
jgi:hypothetical protein